MAALHPATRTLLEKAVVAARDRAENAAREAFERLAVGAAKAHDSLSEPEKELRRSLREEARRLGDVSIGGDYTEMHRLVAECAYEQWHRILFARFLAENRLLLHPDAKVPVTLSECEELARDEGASDGWMLAARFAQQMLPGIFRNDDPILQVTFAPEHRQALQKLASDLPPEVFTSDDGLGWVYQFWQTKRKKEVNESGRKIGGDDLSVVTQLFTEPYMVKFLLHNTLGAWWVSRHSGEPLPIEMEYLRFNEDGTPAAGDFEGWPNKASELKIMDPCCGSGHFLVAAFEIMVAFRKAEEDLSDADAGFAVLRDNLHGLELDPRCTQIAAFNLLLAAWKLGAYRPLPLPNLACAGLSVGGNPKEWQRLALRTTGLEAILNQLFTWFQQASNLGSLIDPEKAAGSMYRAPDWTDVLYKLRSALDQFKSENDPVAAIFGEAALGAACAAELLFSKYHLVCTNVPYLARGKQDANLRDYLGQQFPDSKADIATAFVERCISMCKRGGSTALVTPQNWLFLGSYAKLRSRLLATETWNCVVRLGEGAFSSSQAAGAFTALCVLEHQINTSAQHCFFAIEASKGANTDIKAGMLAYGNQLFVNQDEQRSNPMCIVSLGSQDKGEVLGNYVLALQGISTADNARFCRNFWELYPLKDVWKRLQGPVDSPVLYGGRQSVIHLSELKKYSQIIGAAIRGKEAWGKSGVVIGQMRSLPATIYTGDLFANSCPAIIPANPMHLPAVWAFCQSGALNSAIRKTNSKLSVDNGYIKFVPFDLKSWLAVANEEYPAGLPEPQSDDPTQWLFEGNVDPSDRPLHVAVARLLGYQWPDAEPYGRTQLADEDGIVCLPAVAGDQPAAERLRALMAAAYGARFTPQLIDHLVTADTHPDHDLELWLRGKFFASHCALFHNRPFLWHLWDGRRDGFSAIVNYHKLDGPNLQKLIYTYLGSWIRDQSIANERGEPGADGRLFAANALQDKLRAILDGEPPFDIYVRWKPTYEQPIGWEPELNDGVRINIRPFVEAGILRSRFTIHWNKDKGKNSFGSDAARFAAEHDKLAWKDRGRNPLGADRLNDIHLSRDVKERARTRRRDEQQAAIDKAIQSDGLAMDAPVDARADETDLFGVPRQKDLFGVIVEDEGKRKRR